MKEKKKKGEKERRRTRNHPRLRSRSTRPRTRETGRRTRPTYVSICTNFRATLAPRSGLLAVSTGPRAAPRLSPCRRQSRFLSTSQCLLSTSTTPCSLASGPLYFQPPSLHSLSHSPSSLFIHHLSLSFSLFALS